MGKAYITSHYIKKAKLKQIRWNLWKYAGQIRHESACVFLLVFFLPLSVFIVIALYI